MSDGRGGDPEGAGEAADELYDAAACGLLLLGPDGAVRRANAAFARWMDMPAEALAGRRFGDLLTLPGRIVYETNLTPLLRLQGGFEEVALDFIPRGGGKLPTLANAVARLGPGGAVEAVHLAVFRAHERRNYELGLQRQEAAARQSLSDERGVAQLREQFIAVLGHDLRNPLASVVGAARLLRREAQTPKALKVIGLMEASVARMVGLIDDVMDFARGRLGSGISVTKQLLPIEPVLRHVVAELESGRPGRTIVLSVDAPEPIWFDPGRIGQLASNLVGNALTHGDADTPVLIAARVADGELELSVANAGPPIPPEALPHLFQPFVRGVARPHDEGLGLGLHIAAEIARAHEGALGVASDAAETRFTLRMPVGAA